MFDNHAKRKVVPKIKANYFGDKRKMKRLPALKTTSPVRKNVMLKSYSVVATLLSIKIY